MLIEFSVGNYLSIKDRQTLRLDASSISEYKDQLIDAGRYQLLRSAVIYGANASGKSNVLKAMATMREFVLTSVEKSSTATIEVEPFLLNTETESAPSHFEVLFWLDGSRYRYGFNADRIAVRTEWLYVAKKEQEKPLFLRENDGIEAFKDFKEGKGLEEKTRNNALFLSVCDQFNGTLSKQIMEWFDRWLSISGTEHKDYRDVSFILLEATPMKHRMVNLLGKLDLGFSNISVQKSPITNDFLSKYPEKDRQQFFDAMNGQFATGARTIHKKHDAEKRVVGEVLFEMDDSESAGTNKLFDLLGPVYMSLIGGRIFIVDELDAKLHPLMTQAIIRLFNDPMINPNNAQLIFATHDTNLLTYGGFRRDQIYFTEKDQFGATCLYSLVEYQEENGEKVRKDRSFEKDYIQGRYGAIPFIGDLSKLVPAWHEK